MPSIKELLNKYPTFDEKPSIQEVEKKAVKKALKKQQSRSMTKKTNLQKPQS